MRQRLNPGPLPGSSIDCSVQRLALTLRYHYSSIDRPALKSKSHLVAQATISGSGDLEIFVSLCLLVDSAQAVFVSYLDIFQGCSSTPTHPNVQMCVLFVTAGNFDLPSRYTHTHTHI